MGSKLQVYNSTLSLRDELKADEVSAMSDEIQHKVLTMEEFRTALRVGLYASSKNEVMTDILFREGDKHRKEMYYPALDKTIGGLAYFRVIRPEEIFVTESGFCEPSPKQSRLRDLNTLTVLIVPGVAFDLHGNRIGLAGGFFDKCLVSFRGKRIALAYDFQVLPELPTVARGRKLDWIVTEKRIIRCQ
jgi:5-formyltetrahydrofolate cyclo-ligase